MKNYYFFLISLFIFFFSSCGENVEERNDGAGNTTDVAVTGNVVKVGVSYALIDGYVNLELVGAGNSSLTLGIELSATEDFTNAIKLTTKSIEGRKISVKTTALDANTRYFYRTFVYAESLKYYGEKRSFMTRDFSNIMSTGDASQITFTSANVTCEMKVKEFVPDEDEFFSIGILCCDQKGPLAEEVLNSKDIDVAISLLFINNVNIPIEKGQYIFEKKILQLNNGKTYYYCVYTKYGNTYRIGNVKSFTTKTLSLSDLDSGKATDIGHYMATINFSSTLDDYYPQNTNIKYGIHYSTNPNSFDNNRGYNSKASTRLSEIIFSVSLSDLLPGTTYYYRAFAEVNGSLLTGEVNSFTTIPEAEPNGDGTKNNPFNVAAAIKQAYNNNKGTFYIKGVVRTNPHLGNGGTSSYTIADDESTKVSLRINNSYYYCGSSFNSDNFLKIGDNIVVVGILSKDSEAYMTGTYLFSLNGKLAPEEVKNVSVKQFLSERSSNYIWYKLKGVVKNMKASTIDEIYFEIEDETGAIDVYGLRLEKDGDLLKYKDAVALGIKNGITIELIGLHGSYWQNDGYYVTGAFLVDIED